MSTQLLTATLGADEGTESPARLAVTPGVIGVSVKCTTGGSDLDPIPVDSIRVLLFNANEDLGATPTVADIEDQLNGSALGEVLPVVSATASDVRVAASEFLAASEWLYAVVRIDKALSADVTLDVQVSEV